MSFPIPFEFHKGDRLDGMTFIKPVARGGNGDLYLVRDDSESILALKVIRKIDNDGERNGIEQCRAVSSHISGLVPILKTGKFVDGRFYCVMPPADNMLQWPEYKPDTLADRIRQSGRISPDEVLEIADGILTTIKALHDVGLSHCDLKPENVLFINGKPMLSDYSLLSDSAEHSAGVPRSTVGTIGFVPPEMMEYPGGYNPMASDLYAVGKIIYCAWTGTDVVMFPSVPKDIELYEIGIMRPLYMKACNAVPNGRYKNAEEFILAVSNARSLLNHSTGTRVQSLFRANLPVLLFALLIFLCAIGLVNIFLQIQSGKTKQGSTSGSSDLYYTVIPDEGKAPNQNSAPPDPLVVTTNSDIENPSDGVNSLREAFGYAQRHGAGATISFAGDFEIRLSSPLSVTQNVILDGGKHKITLTGPETEPMFQVREARLTLKNMSLISDYAGDGGGILDAKAPGRVVLSSVKDGGKTECLWCISGKVDMDVEDGSHLHRVQVKPNSGGGNIRIKAGSVLEDLVYTGDSRNRGEGNCDVYELGFLKNASVSDVGDIYVNSGGTAENITVQKDGFLQVRPGGTVNGVKVEFRGVMGYMDKSIATGTISIGGVAWEPYGPGVIGGNVDGVHAFPVIDGRKTDIVFDLTERTEDSRSWFNMTAEVIFGAMKNFIEGPEATRLLFNDLASFLGAHSYTVRVRVDQPAGTYLLGTQADKFDSAVSLVIGDKIHRDALVIGKPFSIGNRVYTLVLDYWESQNDGYLTNYEVRTLMLKVDEQ